MCPTYLMYVWLLFLLNIFHNIYVEGLLFSRPWVCRRWLLEPLFFDLRGTRNTVIVFVVVFSLNICWGSPFLLAVSGFAVIAGFPLFGPPRDFGRCRRLFSIVFDYGWPLLNKRLRRERVFWKPIITTQRSFGSVVTNLLFFKKYFGCLPLK